MSTKKKNNNPLQPRDDNNHFTSNSTEAKYKALRKAFLRAVSWRDMERLTKGLMEIAESKEEKTADRLKAYEMLMARALGKIPDPVKVEAKEQNQIAINLLNMPV